ncbi:YheC/YheD family protein [Metabacillus litoralis]|uniref:YheC/YheD family protein n=1 Tax=Metabacillus litoralis TaxID=152268 RepID=A0A5C6W4F1_9BACI|nr:YheC/YheD family protein [Metabacillus litoralis]TXC92806.1 YheC/YheD family protein [Metabacillus litoralis]
MTLIGMLHRRKSPYVLKRAYAYAAVSKMENVEFFYFSFESVNFQEGKISGWVYDDREWKRKDMSFPDVVINSCSPRNKREYQITRKLKKQCLFTSYSVGNKMSVHKKIVKAKQFSDFIIPSYYIKSGKEALPHFSNNEKLVLKSLSGKHGKGVLFIECIETQRFKVVVGSEVKIYSEDELVLYIDDLIKEKKYMLQPFIECKTKAGLTYDFRLHVQKNGQGIWEINLIYPRISGSSRLVSNVSSGGYRGELDSFLKDEFDEDYFNMKRLLEQFTLSFTKHFESLYSKEFDELGIDVGLDSNKKLWIYEVNWRPGAKFREFEVAKKMIPYCLFLIRKNNS